MTAPTTWLRVCSLTDLPLERGVPALVEGEQVALYKLSRHEVVAVQHRDPYSGANVLARGIIGSRDVGILGPMVTLTSPLHKQVWDIRTGGCLDAGGKELLGLRTWSVRVDDGHVLVGTTTARGAVPEPTPGTTTATPGVVPGVAA